jgi:hypothetical protein
MIQRLRRPIEYRKGSRTTKTGVEAAFLPLSLSLNEPLIHSMAFFPIHIFYNSMVDMRDVYYAQRGRKKKSEAELIDEHEN